MIDSDEVIEQIRALPRRHIFEIVWMNGSCVMCERTLSGWRTLEHSVDGSRWSDPEDETYLHLYTLKNNVGPAIEIIDHGYMFPDDTLVFG